MTLGDSLRSYLVGVSALNMLCGNRVYPQRLPQGPTLPAVIYHLISRRPVHVRTGIIQPIVAVRVQFDVVAELYGQVEAVAGALKTALYAYVDNDPCVYCCMVEDEGDDGVTEPTLRQFGRRVDAFVWYAES